MKKNLLTVTLVLFYFVGAVAQSDLRVLLSKIDDEIKHKDVYIDLKERKIENLKARKKALRGAALEEYAINDTLFNEYKNYISDSAIYYLHLNLDIANTLSDEKKGNDVRIASSFLFARLGMYKEASDLLASIPVDALDSQELLAYHASGRELYLGLGQYSQNTRERHRYWEMANVHNDALKRLAEPGSEEYLRVEEKALRLTNDYQGALAVNDQRLKLAKPNTPVYALVTFHRSLIYRKMQDVAKEKQYLALSALSDIQLAIKDNASISLLADLLMHEGDVNRAYQYIRFSLENAKDYNTRIRSAEILKIQTIIDKAYQLRNDRKNRELQILLGVLCVLSILLVISVLYVYKHMRKGQVFSQKLKEINEELESFNARLHDMNMELTKRNNEVAEANHIKEEYIAYFLDECSKYIVKLDNYRKMVYKKVQDKQYEELYKITRSTSLREEELRELFVNFDTMFITIFPDFFDTV